MTLIGVKSKYGSCSGNCTGFININNKPLYMICKDLYIIYKKNTRKVPFVGMTGWAVNSIAIRCRRFNSFSSYIKINIRFTCLQSLNYKIVIKYFLPPPWLFFFCSWPWLGQVMAKPGSSTTHYALRTTQGIEKFLARAFIAQW